MYSNILVRFGELSTKGKNKMTFVRHLAKNIERKTGEKPEIQFDRIFMNYSESNIKALGYVFGIQSYSPVARVATDIEEIKRIILKSLENIEGKTFKVAVKRHWKAYPGQSMELAASLGGFILKNSDFKVDVRNPDFKVEVEIRKDFSYVFVKRIKGLGGYPTGVNGKVLHLISGGIDSPVAAWEMMKRGIHVDFLNFVTPPHTDEKSIDKVNRIIQLLMEYQGSARLYRAHYTDLMNYIGMTSDQSYKITLMRRSFYRIASKVAKYNNYLGISNGENVGQVASQTLESMAVIQNQSSFPVYRPILTADKLETIDKGIKLDTYKISIEEGEEACELFTPAKPVIKPKLFIAEKLEAELSQIPELEEKHVKNNIEIHKFQAK
ncbi:MAG: tRNA 4-thiouridine(8) synthase ThiI [Mycoplasmataceae bacterium]|nr:tRNA 4-thiouridine(8) synthase ThiI [Mycoplasmataceae bacterium]